MPKPIDATIYAPQRREAQTSSGWDIFITPPEILDLPEAVVHLTEDQHRRYLIWRDTGALIQDVLPDLNADQRERLMTGLMNDDFRRFTESNDDE
jgi:hypothetical protein